MENNFSFHNNQKSDNQVFLQKFQNQNKFQKVENKNTPINKDSYLFHHSKKFLNKTPTNENSNINNNNLIDFTEPQPQSYQDLNLNINTNTEYKFTNSLSSKNNNNINFQNQTKNKKLLEEYFKLKNDNTNSNNNYYTYNNNIYKPNNKNKDKEKLSNNININTNNNICQNPEPQYQPLVKRQKTKKINPSNTKNILKTSNNKNPNYKKSLKGANSLSKIYKPDKNIKNSPSFTPIKNTIPTKENNKNSPYFGLKSNSNSNIDIKNNNKKIIKPKILQDSKNSQRITHSEESDIHIKSIIKNNNFLSQIEKNNKSKIKNNISQIPIKKNLTPSRKEVQTCFDFKKKNLLKNNDKTQKSYVLMTNLTSTSYNNISSINSTESYWRKKDREKRRKMEQIKTERILKEEKELQEKPKINYNSKKIMGKKYQNKTDVFDRLSDISQIQNHNDQIEKIRERFKESHTPLINDNSRRMKRTIDDLYRWKNKNDRKKMESAKFLNKINKNKKIVINPQSEEILKEKKSDYINKKVEDRLLEQGRLQQYKNEVQREQYLNYITKSKKYINNEYVNIHSRYLESPNCSKDNNNQKEIKSCDRIINRGNMINYKTISLRNNNNINSEESFDNNNNYNKGDINYFNGMNNQNKKEVFFGDNNGSNLINGNINNYIINNNFNNNIMLKPEKNQNEINDNIINNHYQYYPNYLSNRKMSNSCKNNKNIIKNNNNIEQKNYFNFQEENVKEKKLNNNPKIENNLNSKKEQNDIMNIRKHLNEFYDNKKNNRIQPDNLENYINRVKNKDNDEIIRNGLLKGILGNNIEQNIENMNNRGNYQKNINNYSTNINSNNISNQLINNINSFNSKNNVAHNINEINNINENKQKYNFKPELLQDIHRIPKSSGLNFNLNRDKNFNYFQFQFDRNEKNNCNQNLKINENNIQQPYEYIQNNDNEKGFLYNNDSKIKNTNEKYTIEDSVNINNIISNSNTNIINNNNLQNFNNNFDDIEKERRKKDLLQMINFSSNLKINNNNIGGENYKKNSNYNLKEENIQNNFNEYENYNIIQSYEES